MWLPTPLFPFYPDLQIKISNAIAMDITFKMRKLTWTFTMSINWPFCPGEWLLAIQGQVILPENPGYAIAILDYLYVSYGFVLHIRVRVCICIRIYIIRTISSFEAKGPDKLINLCTSLFVTLFFISYWLKSI